MSARRTLLRELALLIQKRARVAVLVLHASNGSLELSLRDDMASRIRPFVRLDDFMCLLEDGSLVVLLRDVGDRASAIGAAQRLFQRCTLLQMQGTAGEEPGAAFGIVMLPSDIGSASGVLARAQQAARYASRTRARWVCWSDAPGDADSVVLSREDALAGTVIQGLSRGEFELFYQPQLSMADGSLRGLEALIRWRRGNELVMPDSFIPAVENAGLSASLGAWVLREACRQLAAWREAGVACPRVAINLSASQLQSDLLDLVWRVLTEFDVPADQLEIELTEAAQLPDPADALACARQLSEMGVGFSLDDFGTGHSSFLRLKSAPFNAVKLERRFVAGMLTDRYDREMLKSVIDFAKRVKLDSIAEGVETVEQLEALRRMGCNAWQGYLCARPMEAGRVQAFLQERGSVVPGR